MAAPKEEKVDDNEEEPEMTQGYTVPDKVGVDDLMKKDADDEALQKYKAALIGNAKDKIIDEKDKRLIFFDQLVIEPTGGDKKQPIVLDPSKCKADEVAFTLKEKATYRVVIKFRVQREIISGLKRFMVIKKKGIFHIPLYILSMVVTVSMSSFRRIFALDIAAVDVHWNVVTVW